MLSVAVAALAAGVLCWPAAAAQLRLIGLRRPAAGALTRAWCPPIRAWCHWVTRRGMLPVIALAAGSGVLLAGLGGGLAAAAVTATVTTRWRASRERRAAATAATGLSDALGVLVAELRVGAHPADAMQAAAESNTDGSPEAPADAAGVLAMAAAAARLGGDVPAVLRSAAPAHLRSWLSRLAQAWALADRFGIPLADLLDAVRCDTEHRVRFGAEVQARLAGPRATAAVLAGLPVLGLALGQAMGADPVRVLCRTPVGQLLLAIGAGLACAGVCWSARLISGAVAA